MLADAMARRQRLPRTRTMIWPGRGADGNRPARHGMGARSVAGTGLERIAVGGGRGAGGVLRGRRRGRRMRMGG